MSQTFPSEDFDAFRRTFPCQFLNGSFPLPCTKNRGGAGKLLLKQFDLS
jgi:hypothetical protein